MPNPFELTVQPIVLKPGDVFLGEKPSEVGYWGFVRSALKGELAVAVNTRKPTPKNPQNIISAEEIRLKGPKENNWNP